MLHNMTMTSQVCEKFSCHWPVRRIFSFHYPCICLLCPRCFEPKKLSSFWLAVTCFLFRNCFHPRTPGEADEVVL